MARVCGVIAASINAGLLLWSPRPVRRNRRSSEWLTDQPCRDIGIGGTITSSPGRCRAPAMPATRHRGRWRPRRSASCGGVIGVFLLERRRLAAQNEPSESRTFAAACKKVLAMCGEVRFHVRGGNFLGHAFGPIKMKKLVVFRGCNHRSHSVRGEYEQYRIRGVLILCAHIHGGMYSPLFLRSSRNS